MVVTLRSRDSHDHLRTIESIHDSSTPASRVVILVCLAVRSCDVLDDNINSHLLRPVGHGLFRKGVYVTTSRSGPKCHI
jgi:hypothetical protein